MSLVLFLIVVALCVAPLWALRRWAEREPLPEARRARMARRYQSRPAAWDVPDRDYVLS